MPHEVIATDRAPAAIGTYSQAVRAGSTVFLSGQIPLDPVTMQLTGTTFAEQARQAFDNLDAVVEAAGATRSQIVKLTIYLTDLANFPTVNEVMAARFDEPFPARAAVGVAALPRGASIEVEGVLVLDD
jgi:reactive intermediate/imine deaminase